MKLEIKTPSGKLVVINYNVEQNKYEITVPELGLTQATNYLSLSASLRFAQGTYPAIRLPKDIALDKPSYDMAKTFAAETQQAREEYINKMIPGYTELSNAYAYRSQQLAIRDNYMERAINTSIGTGDPGQIENAEELVAKLEEKYPVAKMYLYWISRDPASDFGFRANQAAKELLAGKSLEEAMKILNR